MSELEWQVGRVQDIAEPGALEFSVGQGDWPFRGFVVRWSGQLIAYENKCPHAGHPLNFKPDGFFNLDRSLLLCSSHGAVFEPGSGECVAGPCAGSCLRMLDCREADGNVYVRAPQSQHG